MRFGEKIRQLRQERDWSQEQLAKMVGAKSRSMISKIESGQRMTPLDVVSKFAKVFGVPVSDLIDEEPSTEEPIDEFLPYMKNAQDWQLEAIRKILDMPQKKIYNSEKEII